MCMYAGLDNTSTGLHGCEQMLIVDATLWLTAFVVCPAAYF